MSTETCMCGHSEESHGWGDPPHMFHSQDQGVVNPEAIGDPDQTPVVQIETDDDCPMHSADWLHAAVRNNRRLMNLAPQECSKGCAS